MAASQNNAASDSHLYKAFFDDATLSDLTIRLSDRTVSVHRVVLCRPSEYFTKLLTGRFRESGAKEIILEEDDADSMVALLRYIYGLPFDEPFAGRRHLLQPHAKVYVVAEKYQIQGLKFAVYKSLKRMLQSETDLWKENADGSIVDFMDAFQAVDTGTAARNDQLRKMMVDACIWNLRYLRQKPRFLAILEHSPGLSVAIISHLDLECSLPGDWVCEVSFDRQCDPMCLYCKESFGEAFAIRHRDDHFWYCQKCEKNDIPICGDCEQPVVWQRRGL